MISLAPLETAELLRPSPGSAVVNDVDQLGLVALAGRAIFLLDPDTARPAGARGERRCSHRRCVERREHDNRWASTACASGTSGAAVCTVRAVLSFLNGGSSGAIVGRTRASTAPHGATRLARCSCTRRTAFASRGARKARVRDGELAPPREHGNRRAAALSSLPTDSAAAAEATLTAARAHKDRTGVVPALRFAIGECAVVVATSVATAATATGLARGPDASLPTDVRREVTLGRRLTEASASRRSRPAD